jgi:3-dehydroquinate synthase
MVKVKINLGERSYPIHITSDYKDFGKSITSTKLAGKFVVITDSNVDLHQAGAFIEALEASGLSPYKFVIPAGEVNKNLDTVRGIYKFLLDLKLDRSTTLIALGGGVIGDITGFVAATFLRGINFVQVPTTSLAQADSSVGGKVGVDFDGIKNVIGSFYQPKYVYMNVNTLKTLPKRDMISGLAEVIKHGIISDMDFFEFIDYNVKKIFNYDDDVLQYLAKVNCSIKGRIVEQDEKESGLRKNLNFGHTIGHAIESISNFDLMHGECVSLGMVGAFKMARRLDMIGEDTVNKVVQTLEKIGLPVRLHGLNIDKVYRQMFFDKKIENNKLLFILPKAIGEVVQISIEDEGLIKKVLEDLG